MKSKYPLCPHCEFEKRIQLYDSLIFNVLPSSDLKSDGAELNNPEVVSSSLTNGIALQIILQFFTLSKATLNNNDESRRFVFSFFQM